MNDQQKQCSGVPDQEARAALDQHWAASDANDFETEHVIITGHNRVFDRRCSKCIEPTPLRFLLQSMTASASPRCPLCQPR
jgi:hypothetical protein